MLKQVLRLVIATTRRTRQVLATAQNVFIGGKALGGLGECTVPLEAREPYRRRADDASGNVVLYSEDILDLGIVGFGPDVPRRCGLGQLSADAHPVAGAANAAFEQVSRVEQAPDLGRRE